MADERSTAAPRRKHGRSAKQDAQRFEIEKRRARVAELRISGYGMREIAAELGVSLGTVHNDLAAAFERTKEAADDVVRREREMAIARLDVATRGLWPQVQKGKAIAVDVLVKVEARRAKLTGVDVADKHEHTGKDGAPIEVTARSALEQKLHDLGKRLSGGAAGGQEPGGTPGAGPASA